MSNIRLLSPDLINKIAAGEVVERPASAVKELIENSIDASSTDITLNLENGGLTKIEVVDNGSGMGEEDAKMALQQHATSKLKSEKDLENIGTLGFRGEALASISSVSDTIIHTFDGSGTPYISFSKNGAVITEAGKGRVKGTTVSVNNIFSRVPARRKFLKSPATEYKYILNTFISIALSHPEIGFRLIKDGKTQIILSKNDTSISRIIKLFPSYKEDDFIKVFYDNPVIKITGYIGHPSKARQDNSIQHIFINRRFVKDPLISKAVKDGFSSTLMNHSYPLYFLYYEIDNSKVDVNIHPRKLEVRYSDPSAIFTSTKNAIEKSLQNALKRELLQRAEPEFRNINNYSSTPRTSGSIQDSMIFTKNLLEPLKSVSRIHGGVEQDFQTISFSSQESQEALFSSTFQVFNTFIILEKGEKLMIIDQHAADERVNYEKLIKKLIKKPELDPIDLLIPLELVLNPSQIEIIKIKKNQLEKLGFACSVNKSKCIIKAIPSVFNHSISNDAFVEILNDLNSESSSDMGINSATKKQNRLIATLACHSSIRAGQKLESTEMQQLLFNLFACELPYSCPHGRPIIWELTKYELEKNFKRKL